ncbi:hypothetical protein HZC09_04145 [Candidatus Micrarchaeota archaeon]|nr:hypothetical protein [Candidatus Micrarchaeota archaeon]
MPLPKLRIIFHYGPHAGVLGARHLPALLEKYDPHVFCPESAEIPTSQLEKIIEARKRWREDVRKMGEEQLRRKLARITSEDEKFAWAQIAVLSDRDNIKEWLLEHHAPESAEYAEKVYEQYTRANGMAHNLFGRGELAKAEELLPEADKYLRLSTAHREQNIIENAKTLREQLLKKYPELENEEEIRVLARLGTAHTQPYISLHGLKQRGITVERVFDTPPNFPLETQALRKTGEAKKITATRDLAAEQIMCLLDKAGFNSFLYPHLGIDLATELTYEDIRSIENKIKGQTPGGRQKWEKIKGAFTEAFRNKGIVLPTNKKEADEMFKERVLDKWGAKWSEPYFASDNIPPESFQLTYNPSSSPKKRKKLKEKG